MDNLLGEIFNVWLWEYIYIIFFKTFSKPLYFNLVTLVTQLRILSQSLWLVAFSRGFQIKQGASLEAHFKSNMCTRNMCTRNSFKLDH